MIRRLKRESFENFEFPVSAESTLFFSKSFLKSVLNLCLCVSVLCLCLCLCESLCVFFFFKILNLDFGLSCKSVCKSKSS